jgi:shikimate kinase
MRVAIDHRPSTIDRIFLVGFMGAGKTTVGQLLAQRLGWSFVDLDDRVRAREGREIADIFRESGEDYFRKVEHECLRELMGEDRVPRNNPTLSGETRARQGWGKRLAFTAGAGIVVALGGGAFVQAENAAMLPQSGAPVIFLDADVQELRRRCLGESVVRPLLRDENQFRQLYEARRSGYMAADFRLDTGGKTPQQVVDELLALALSSQL